MIGGAARRLTDEHSLPHHENRKAAGMHQSYGLERGLTGLGMLILICLFIYRMKNKAPPSPSHFLPAPLLSLLPPEKG